MTVRDSMYLYLRLPQKYLMLRKDSFLEVTFQTSIITNNLDIFFFKHAALFLMGDEVMLPFGQMAFC